MPERRFELVPSPEVWTRVVEANVDKLHGALFHATWQDNPSRGSYFAKLRFYLTDTGHLCRQDDTQVEAVCVADFVHHQGQTHCSHIDVESVAGEPTFSELLQIAERSAQGAAEQFSEIPRYLSPYKK